MEGKRRLVDKSISPQDIVRALADGDITIAQAQQMYNGVIPIGDYLGVAAIFDLDKLVIQPLAQAEPLYILGILDGREEDYDLQTITIPSGAKKDSQVAEDLTVPTGEVWFVTAIELFTPADQGGTPAINWHCSLWTDRATVPSDYGQPFHAAALSATPLGNTWWDEFHGAGPFMDANNKPVALRLPAGTVITFVATNLTLAATADMACTGKLHGWIGKALGKDGAPVS